MAAISLKSDLSLQTSGDATPGTASLGVSTIPTLTTGNSISVQRAAAYSYSNTNFSWEEIQEKMNNRDENFEDTSSISRKVSRRGIRRPTGILYPRGTYIPYRRRFYRSIY
tara:strand:+ start:80 stop:412 length:333 start_codon:yes stop_codon:yes gene_type:complete